MRFGIRFSGIAAVTVAGLALPAPAALIMSESFVVGANPAAGEYEVGDIAGQNPTTAGATGAWMGNLGLDVTSGLVYSDPLYSQPDVSGGLAGSNNYSASRLLSAPVTSATTGTIYGSFLMVINTGGNSNNYRAFHLSNGDSDIAFELGFGNTDFGTHDLTVGNEDPYRFRVNQSNGTRTDLGAAVPATVNLFVYRFDLTAAAEGDSVTVWHNPDLSAGEPAGGATVSGIDIVFDRFGVTTPAGSTASYDEIRLGTTWDSVVVPEPAGLVLLGLGAAAACARRRPAA